MLDLAVMVKALTFGGRNADKVLTSGNGSHVDDRGRVAATTGQLTSAAKAAAKLDNALGKSTQAAINLMCGVAKENKALEYVTKGADWASRNVNPLLVGAAGYRVLTSEDKEAALKKEVFGMSAMFGVEALMKEFLNSKYLDDVHHNMKNKYAKAAVAVLEGLGFVIGSIGGSTAGYKLGELYVEKTELNRAQKKIDYEKLNAEILKMNNKVENKAAKTVDEDDLDDKDLGGTLVKKEVLA